MSNITTVYDTIVSAIGTVLTNHTRIPNPLSLEDNSIVFLRNGYGVNYNGSVSVPAEFCTFSREHTFSVVITKEVLKLESATTETDTVNKALLEEVYDLHKDFYDPDELGIPNSIRYVNLGGVSSIDNITVGKSNFRTISAEFIFNVTENI